MRSIFIPIIGQIQETTPEGQLRTNEYGLFPMSDGWYILDENDNAKRLLTTDDLGNAGMVPFGTKSSATDEGELGQQSMDDDYYYLCTTAGSAGNAVWKRIPIFKSN